ncbi:hypothetical protein [Sinorhizobium fredii]|uniref:hypothetical protein n=1 Tax=Rhizobium fredii TaxID=380 RepID=UPI001FCBF965|nr:hypothetical protein [Sinorhizobium fredii]
MKDEWHGRNRRDAQAGHGGRFRDRDRGGEGEWFADSLRHSDRVHGDFPFGRGRDLAHRIEALGSFDPYENVPPFRNRSGQEDWPGGRKNRGAAGSFRGKSPRGRCFRRFPGVKQPTGEGGKRAVVSARACKTGVASISS